MWKNPMKDESDEKAYAKNQVTKVMSFDEFVAHISSHNGVFSRGTVKGVVSDTCSCLVEQLLGATKCSSVNWVPLACPYRAILRILWQSLPQKTSKR